MENWEEYVDNTHNCQTNFTPFFSLSFYVDYFLFPAGADFLQGFLIAFQHVTNVGKGKRNLAYKLSCVVKKGNPGKLCATVNVFPKEHV